MAKLLPIKPNCCLVNQYQDGNDSMGLHSDDEPQVQANSMILSLSFGATRTFIVQNKREEKQKKKLVLAHGDLLIMLGRSRQHLSWHGLPKDPKIDEPRINLTFRFHSLKKQY